MDATAALIVSGVREGPGDPHLIAAWIWKSAEAYALIEALPLALINEQKSVIDDVQDAIVQCPSFQGRTIDLHGEVKRLHHGIKDQQPASAKRARY
jgi:hypothetical protein